MSPSTSLTLRVSAIRAEAKDILSFELRGLSRLSLPPFLPGAHLEIWLPSDRDSSGSIVRQYSICNSPGETDRYVITVGKSPQSRGGSRIMHEGVRVGSILTCRGPRNNFVLVNGAAHYSFVAGGIGITPILSMIRWCESNAKSWSLLYCARSRLRAAFCEFLQCFDDRVQFHFDDEWGGRLANIDAMFSQPRADEHVYCCGPGDLMRSVRAATQHYAAGTVHFEWFRPEPDAVSTPTPLDEFDVILRSSGARYRVARDRSILETLEAHGIEIPFSCREGLCRSCEVRLCSGEVDHRDFVLSEQERALQKSLLVCVSRARTSVIEIDI